MDSERSQSKEPLAQTPKSVFSPSTKSSAQPQTATTTTTAKQPSDKKSARAHKEKSLTEEQLAEQQRIRRLKARVGHMAASPVRKQPEVPAPAEEAPDVAEAPPEAWSPAAQRRRSTTATITPKAKTPAETVTPTKVPVTKQAKRWLIQKRTDREKKKLDRFQEELKRAKEASCDQYATPAPIKIDEDSTKQAIHNPNEHHVKPALKKKKKSRRTNDVTPLGGPAVVFEPRADNCEGWVTPDPKLKPKHQHNAPPK